jgi:hypothetical protein
MLNNRESYNNFIKTICNHINNNEITDDIIENIDEITDSLIEFSKYFDKFIEIIMDNNKKHNDKVNDIMKLSFRGNHLTKEQVEDVLKRMKILHIESKKSYKGGSNSIDNILPSFKNIDLKKIEKFRGVNFNYSSTTNKPSTPIERFTSFFSYYFFRMPMLYTLKFIYILLGAPFDGIKINDFSKKIPFLQSIFYIIIVIFGAIIPFAFPILGSIAGIFTDFAIFFWALMENRIYLALITFISSILSLFTLRILDLGAILKIFYIFDVYSSDNDNLMKDQLGITQTTLIDKDYIEKLTNDKEELINKMIIGMKGSPNNQILRNKIEQYIDKKLKKIDNKSSTIEMTSFNNLNTGGNNIDNFVNTTNDISKNIVISTDELPFDNITSTPEPMNGVIYETEDTSNDTVIPTEDISIKDTSKDTVIPTDDLMSGVVYETEDTSKDAVIPTEDISIKDTSKDTVIPTDNLMSGVVYETEDTSNNTVIPTEDISIKDTSKDTVIPTDNSMSGVVYETEDTSKDAVIPTENTSNIQILDENTNVNDIITDKDIDKFLLNNKEIEDKLIELSKEINNIENINKTTGGNKIIYKKKNKKKISKKHTSKRKNMRL